MTSYEKCMAALGSYKVVRKFEEKLLFRSLHFTDGGRLDFHRYKSARDVSLGELMRLSDFPCVVVFSDTQLPPIKCCFKRVLECLNEVLTASRCVWIMDDDRTRVIEFYHNGEVTMCGM